MVYKGSSTITEIEELSCSKRIKYSLEILSTEFSPSFTLEEYALSMFLSKGIIVLNRYFNDRFHHKLVHFTCQNPSEDNEMDASTLRIAVIIFGKIRI